MILFVKSVVIDKTGHALNAPINVCYQERSQPNMKPFRCRLST